MAGPMAAAPGTGSAMARKRRRWPDAYHQGLPSAPGVTGTPKRHHTSCARSPGPLCGRTRVPGVSDTAEPRRPHENGRPVLPSTFWMASALRMTAFSVLDVLPRAPLPTLRLPPREGRRTAQGKDGASVLPFTGLSPAVHDKVRLALPGFAPLTTFATTCAEQERFVTLCKKFVELIEGCRKGGLS